MAGHRASQRAAAGPLRIFSIELAIWTLWVPLTLLDGVLTLLQAVLRPLARLLSQDQRKPHVVVVGASFGGLAVQHALAERRDLRVSLVDFKDYFEYTPGVRQERSERPAFRFAWNRRTSRCLRLQSLGVRVPLETGAPPYESYESN